MSWQLINCKKAYEMGPKAIADLRRQEASLRAMGNTSGANILKAQYEAAQDRWAAYSELHEPAPLGEYKGSRDLKKIDTQGL